MVIASGRSSGGPGPSGGSYGVKEPGVKVDNSSCPGVSRRGRAMMFVVAVLALPAIAGLLAMAARMEHLIEGEPPIRER
jgi:hypothetical protein